MFRTLAVAVLLGIASVPALAMDRAALENQLRDDEKALLAAVLIDKTAAAEFDADLKLADADAKTAKLVLDKWRGRCAAFANSDKGHPNPDLEGTYKNYGAMLSPQIKAYLVRRLKTMKEDDRNSLIEYLNAVNESLADDGKLSWYTKKVVAGIFDKYRSDLTEYLATPLGRDAQANGKKAEAALAASRGGATAPTDDVAARQRAEQERQRLERERQASRKPPQGGGPKPEEEGITITKPPVVETKPLPGETETERLAREQLAIEQARRIAERGTTGGGQFDGNTRTGTDDVVVPGGNGDSTGGSTGLTRGGTAESPNLVAEVPSPTESDDEFLDNIGKLKTGDGPLQPRQYLPGATGALLGGILGFLLGGLPGLFIGLGLGMIAGDQIGRRMFK